MTTWLHIALPFFLEIPALAAVIYCVYRAQKNRIYPALWQLLIFWAASDALLLAEVSLHRLHLASGVQAYYAYAFTYWPSFAINSVLVLRVLHEMFRHAVRSIPGVQKMGRPIYFWALVVSVVLAFSASIAPHAQGMDFLSAAGQALMRSQSVLALCMVTFLAFSSRTLGVSYGSRIFGVTFGFALMATANLVTAALLLHITSLANTANIVLEIVNIAAIGIWAVYFLKPEPARRLVTMPTTSPLMLWNDVAQRLGNPAGQVAVSYPPSFMTSVTQLVEHVMGPVGAPRQMASRPPGPNAS
ncbi:MAG: hypothetical protein ACYDC6_12200 [Acidobacteriaceae bacterium]